MTIPSHLPRDFPLPALHPLAHPLPAGMRDLLPEEAQRRRALSRRVLDHFALHGYQLVTPPAFEFAGVLERGLGTLDPSEVLRFVEPESGEVAALRPDMTPQIARMVATRLGREPWPIRLCYEGTVVRRRQGRARRRRQLYTGPIFHLLARGPGEPIGAGGRYDDLLGRFDMPMPAVGFALHLDAVAWALSAAGVRDEPAPSVLIAEAEGAARLAEALRARGIAAALHPPEDAIAYAAAWRFTHLVMPRIDGAARFAVSRDTEQGLQPLADVDAGDPEALARLVLETASRAKPSGPPCEARS